MKNFDRSFLPSPFYLNPQLYSALRLIIRPFVGLGISILFFLLATPVTGQTTYTVFSENFDSPNSATWVSGSGADADILVGKPWKISSNGVFAARLNGGQLQINSRNGNSAHGQGFAYVPCGGTDSEFDNTYYNPVLSSSAGVITWTFNMQRPTSVSNSSGFSCSSSSSQNNITTGLAFILASNGTSSILSSTGNCSPNGTAVGYAVVFGGGTSANITPRLVQFTNGLNNGTLTNIVQWSSTVPKANYMSVRVTYDPSNNQWSLQVRNDGTSAFANPAAGTYGTAVTGTNSTYANQALNYMGGYFQSGCTGNCDEASNGYITRYDNLTVTVTTTCVAPSQPSPITGTNSVCAGATGQTYSVPNDANATGYTWTLPAGWSGSSTTNSITATAGSGGGTISVTATNGCGTSAAQTLAVSINNPPAQPGTLSGNTTLCEGDTETYTVTNDPAATGYTWTLPAGWTGSSTTNTISATAGSGGGTISVTANNSCGSSSVQSLAVTLNNVPAQPSVISGITTFCAGDTETYTVTNDPAATGYTWTLPAGWTGSSTTNTISATAGSGGGTISVTANNSCGSSSVQTLAVSISSAPAQPSVISGITTFCAGDTETYTVINDPAATGYTWTLPAGWTGSSTTNSISVTTDASGGTISVTADNTCGSSAAQTLAVSAGSAPVQPLTISGGTTLCAGDTETYAVTADPNATDYTWTLPVGWSGSSTSNSISATADAGSGTVSVMANNACGSSTVQTLAVTVNSIPSQPTAITGDVNVCDGTAESYTVTNDPNATDYTWTLPGGWSGTSTTNSISTTVGANGGTLSVTANNACGSSGTETLVIAVGSAPLQPVIITGGATLCEHDTETYSVTHDANASDYTWTLPSGWSGNSTTNSITATAGAGSGTISVTANNTCGSSTAQTLAVTAGTIPIQPSAISGNANLCDGATGTYSVTQDANASDYTWTLPSGWGGSSTTNSISVTAAAGSGTISVTANNTCGSSVVQTLTVTPGSIPAQPSAISGNSTFCPGDNGTYSVTADPNASSYTWTLPSGWIGSSTSSSINTTAGSNSGTLSVTANNTCGSSASQTFAVSFGNAPAQPSAISGSAGICYGTGDTYSVTLDPSATGYTWTLPSGWSGSSTTNSITATAGSSGGTISVTANNACGSSTAQTLAVTVNTATSATLTQAACNSYTLNGQTYTLSGTYTQHLTNAAGCDSTLTLNLTIHEINLNVLIQNGNILTAQETGAAYQWVDCNNGNAPIPGATGQAYLATSNGSYAVMISKHGCTVMSGCYTITSVSVEETTLSDLLNIYPNPGNGMYSIDFSQFMSEVQLTVYSISGQLIHTENLHAGQHLLLNISEQPPGMYILRLEYNGQTHFTRLIKQ